MGVLLYKMNKHWWFVLVNKTMLYSRAWVDNSSGSLILPSSLINWSDMGFFLSLFVVSKHSVEHVLVLCMCGAHSIITCILTFQMYFFIFVDEENSMNCVISQTDVKVELLKMDYIELSS